MSHRLIVLDQNILRSDDVLTPLLKDRNTHFVLPDLAFVEMTKSQQWESTLHSSMRLLATAPNRVHISNAIGECLRRELTTLKSIEGHMLHRDGSRFVREILCSVRDKVASPALARVRSNPDNHRESLSEDYLHHTKNKEQLANLVEVTKSMLTEDFSANMRRGAISKENKLLAIAEFAQGFLSETLQKRGVSREKARFFLKRKPLTLRWMYLKLWASFGWIEKGGIECLNDKKATNDMLDHEYILTATFFDALLSKENRVNEAYKDMRYMLAARA